MRFGLSAFALTSLLGGFPVAAEVWSYGQQDCNQLWFMRNLIMDRAGYCFGSSLGKSLFDNGDCSGKDVRLAADASQQVKKIQSLEAGIGCKVNTRARQLDLPLMSSLRRLRDMLLPDNGGWACIGWKAAQVPIHDGHTRGARTIGAISAGDRVNFGFLNEGDWVPVVVSKSGGGEGILGWYDGSNVDLRQACTDEAG